MSAAQHPQQLAVPVAAIDLSSILGPIFAVAMILLAIALACFAAMAVLVLLFAAARMPVRLVMRIVTWNWESQRPRAFHTTRKLPMEYEPDLDQIGCFVWIVLSIVAAYLLFHYDIVKF